MTGFLRKRFGHQQPSQSTDEDTDLEKFYTNSEHARQVFEQLVTATTFPKRLLVIHGLGGVGKSTLLKMYALSCRKHHIPAALVASEETPSPVDVLADWADELNHDGLTLPTFHKTLTHYRAIEAKVKDEENKGYQAKSQVAGTLGKTAAKTAISMAASAIPIVGPLVGAVAGESAEAFIDWLHGFLSKPDMQLYLDPAKRLDSDFLSDLTRVAARHRIVLMADTYEQLTALDDWMRELARRLPKNVLLVIAGRTVPEWNRAWQDWMGKAEIVELREMTPDNIRTLVHRYYAFIRSGNPDPKQVEAIVQFARGLPMVATTVVQLWVKYGLEDFQTVRPQVVADLADRLLAEEYLTQAISVAQKLKGHVDAAPVYLATVYEVLKAFDKAEHFYHLSYEEAHPLRRHYFECAALTGLVRVKHAQNDYAAISPLWSEAEQLAQKYEYNDYFTSLYLTRGHITWDGLIPEWESGFDSALHYYQLALIHALRYNRFLLDEALSGREQGTPLRPIIPHCLEHGEEGQRILIALRDWWQSGTNDIGTPRPDTISPIPEGISLLEAERIARDREPGDGSTQVNVVDQISRELAGAEGQ